MIASFPIRQEYLCHLLEPPENTERYVVYEATPMGLSRYLAVKGYGENVLESISSLRERLPPSIKPAVSSRLLSPRMPQKALLMLLEGRHIVPERVFSRKFLPAHTPAYKFVSGRLISPIIDADNVIRILAAMEDRKAVDAEGFSKIKKGLENLLVTYLAGFLQFISGRKNKYKILSSQVRKRAVDDARIREEDLDEPLRKKDTLIRLIETARKHIRQREESAREYTRGSKPAAFLVFTRDNLTVKYIYRVLNYLGEQGYDVQHIIVGFDSASEDIADRIADTLEYMGDVRASKILVPETPGGIIREFLRWLIERRERRGKRLFIDGRGGSPATYLAVLRNFRDRLVLPDVRDFSFV